MTEYASTVIGTGKVLNIPAFDVVPARMAAVVRKLAMVTAAAVAAAFAVTFVSYRCFAIDLGTQASALAEDARNSVEFATSAGDYMNYTARYDYANLDPHLQAAYNRVYKAAFLERDTVLLDGVSAEDASTVLQAVRRDSPELFYVGDASAVMSVETSTLANHVVSTIELSYACEGADLASVRAEYERLMESANSDARARQSDANRVAAICNWMNGHIARSSQATQGRDAYGALAGGQATDAAYAQVFCALCRDAGVSCRITADDQGAPRGSVLVEGSWRTIDPTYRHFA